MQWLTNSRFVALSLTGAACLAACAESSAPSVAESAVDSAYAALVSDVANCAKEVRSCVDAAEDDAAVDTCREQFGSCRQDAGKKNVAALAGAARACTSTHKTCVQAAERGEAGSCQEELRVCLRAARPEKDDDDAGADENDERKAARADCLDELHPCVKADGPANVCAEQVRMCLVDSVPSAYAVVPEKAKGKDKDAAIDEDVAADKDAATDEDVATDEDSTGKGMKGDAGVGRGKSVASKGADAADAGVGSKGMKSQARVCVDSFHACIDAGNPARGCAKSLKDCR